MSELSQAKDSRGPTFEVEVTVRGTIETDYSERYNRSTLANFTVQVDADTAWMIYQAALADAVSPRSLLEVDGR